jgi:hypothetical protein
MSTFICHRNEGALKPFLLLISRLFGVIHAPVWETKTLWARPCQSVSFSQGDRQPAWPGVNAAKQWEERSLLELTNVQRPRITPCSLYVEMKEEFSSNDLQYYTVSQPVRPQSD